MAARIGSANSVTQVGMGVAVRVGGGVRIEVAVGVLIGVKVVVTVGVVVTKRLEAEGMLLRPNHKKAPMTAKINIPARMPIGRWLFLAFGISV